MNKGTYVVYSIEIRGLKGSLKEIDDELRKVGIPSKYLNGRDVSVPRLCTFWRGDEEEQEWAKRLKAAIGEAHIEATVEPWYPVKEWVETFSTWSKSGGLVETGE